MPARTHSVLYSILFVCIILYYNILLLHCMCNKNLQNANLTARTHIHISQHLIHLLCFCAELLDRLMFMVNI